MDAKLCEKKNVSQCNGTRILPTVTGRNFPPVSFFPDEKVGWPILSPPSQFFLPLPP